MTHHPVQSVVSAVALLASVTAATIPSSLSPPPSPSPSPLSASTLEAPQLPTAPLSPTPELVAAATAVLTLDDAGRRFLPARWPGPQVQVSVVGADAAGPVLGDIDQVLDWLSQATGVQFVRQHPPGAAFEVTLAAGLRPQVTLRQRGHTILAAEAQWDPAHPHARRWMWEELLQAAGPAGDWGPPGTLLSTDQAATSPSPFDLWVLDRLYRLEEVDLAGDLAAALTTTIP